MFGERLKQLRKEKGLTQQDLAKLLNISSSTIGMYEQGRRDPDTDTINFLANYFHVSSDYLLGISDNKETFLGGKYPIIAQHFKEIRENEKCTQKQFAMMLNVNESTVSNIETGKSRPGIDLLRKLTRISSLSFEELLTISGHKDLALKLSENKENIENIIKSFPKQIELLDALEDNNTDITAGGQPLSHEQRISILRTLVNPAPTKVRPQVPIIGTIRAGIPLLSKQNIIGEVDIPADLEDQVDFALQVRGDSMIGAGITEGDTVVCKEDQSPNPGQVVVARVNIDETTLKYYVQDNGQKVLRAANPEYEDIELKSGDEIQGRVVKVFKDPPPINLYRDYIYLKEGHLQEWNKVVEAAIAGGIKPDFAKQLIENQVALATQLAKRKSP